MAKINIDNKKELLRGMDVIPDPISTLDLLADVVELNSISGIMYGSTNVYAEGILVGKVFKFFIPSKESPLGQR